MNRIDDLDDTIFLLMANFDQRVLLTEPIIVNEVSFSTDCTVIISAHFVTSGNIPANETLTKIVFDISGSTQQETVQINSPNRLISTTPTPKEAFAQITSSPGFGDFISSSRGNHTGILVQAVDVGNGWFRVRIYLPWNTSDYGNIGVSIIQSRTTDMAGTQRNNYGMFGSPLPPFSRESKFTLNYTLNLAGAQDVLVLKTSGYNPLS